MGALGQGGPLSVFSWELEHSERVEMWKKKFRPTFETHCHFYHILFSKTSLKSNPDSRFVQSHTAKELGYREIIKDRNLINTPHYIFTYILYLSPVTFIRI